jgi:enoyl-CoA hydratase/carnithine racemase
VAVADRSAAYIGRHTDNDQENAISELTFHVDDGVALLTLNRPDKRNAFSPTLLRLWREALLQAQERDDVRAIVLTGAGPDFCAGGDLDNMRARQGEPALQRKESLAQQIQTIPLTLASIDKPVLAAVNGSATGAGMDMALMCDMRICGERTRLAERYIALGILPGAGGAWFLPRLVGTARALELLWTGRWVYPPEALALGLVNEVVPDADVLPRTVAVARQLAAAPPVTVRMMKRAVLQSTSMDLRAHLDQISSHMAVVAATDDHREADEA